MPHPGSKENPVIRNTRSVPARNAALFLLYLAAAAAIGAFFHLRSPNLVDPDAFYHFRHASLYASRGALFSGFPWTTASVLGHTPGDLWYGFHLLLAPFTRIDDGVMGIKIAGIFLLTALMVLFYAVLVRLRIALPYLWPFLLLFSSEAGLMRLIVTRPHVLSTGLLALLLAFFVRGAAWEVGLAAFAVAFFHLNLAWIAVLIAGVVLVIQWRVEHRFEARKGVTAVAGILGGWLLRPEPLGAARLAWVQLAHLAAAKQTGVPLLYGAELSPVGMRGLVGYFGPLLILWLGALLLLLAVRLRRAAEIEPERRVLLGSALLLSLAFCGLTVLISLRASDQWKMLAVLLVAGVYTATLHHRDESAFPGAQARTNITAAGATVLAFMLWRGTSPEALRWAYGTIDPQRYRPAAQWLRTHARRDAVVFNVWWGSFPELFFWDPQNRYINGMDPIFMYAYRPELYWKAHHLATGDATSATCGQPVCGGGDGAETYRVLTRDFGASYLFVEKQRCPALYDYVRGDPRFQPRFDDENAAVFELGRSPDPAAQQLPE